MMILLIEKLLWAGAEEVVQLYNGNEDKLIYHDLSNW